MKKMVTYTRWSFYIILKKHDKHVTLELMHGYLVNLRPTSFPHLHTSKHITRLRTAYNVNWAIYRISNENQSNPEH